MSPRIILLPVLCLLVVSTSFAQGWGSIPDRHNANPYKRLKYTLDTISYEGYTVVRRRSPREELDKYLYKRDATATRQLIDLQESLDNKNTTDAYRDISQIKSMAGGFDISLYEQEAAIYSKVNDEHEARKKRHDDSLRSAANEQRRKDEEARRTARQNDEVAGTEASKSSSPYPDGLDSAAFIKEYGSQMEYNFISSLKYKSSTGCLAVFTGTKLYWIVDLLKYLAALQSCPVGEDIKEGKGWATYKCKCSEGNIVIKQLFDVKTERTSSITITGNSEALIALFLRYWDKSPMNAKRISKGAVIYKDCVSDRITLNWKGAAPVITIGKNPDAHVNFIPSGL